METLCFKGPFWNFAVTLKGENKAFPPLPPPCNVVSLFELSVGNTKQPNFEWRGWRGVWIVLFSEVTPFADNVSIILSPVVASRPRILIWNFVLLCVTSKTNFLFKLSDYILRYSGVKWVYMKASRRKQSTFRDAKARFPEKWRLRNDRKNLMLMTCHYPDWSCRCAGNLLQPIRSTTLLWVVTRHHLGISAFVSLEVISRENQWCLREMSDVSQAI